ncbi:Hch1p like mystery [Cryptosporidium sp. chipmunk genotype I]|uniref:Hch1p like mystery n=1 Tax=Cryptosporidium sp. chipmunk genotype I TaxID=1280935 RepID=UPI003519E129|nr:Hch1p like mystery [Cryptosporidium sp. chipmunk genotype I]
METKKTTEISGSLWNANNWHWEEKDYSRWGKEELRTIMESIKYSSELTSPKFVLSFSNLSIQGEASISVRKKQPILAYEFSISGTWSVNDMEGQEKILLGQITIPEFSVDNYEEDFPVVITCKEVKNKGYGSEPILSEVKKKVVLQLRKELMEFHKKLLNKENDQRKIETEKVKREEEIKTAEIARAQKEEEKRQIYNQQIEKEALIKQRESEASAKTTIDPQPQAQGSVWNANSWHWEEKPETSWAIDRLTKMIEDLSSNKSDSGNSDLIPIRFSEVKVTGEASSSVRKGKKICVLDCSVIGKFNAIIPEGTLSLNKESSLIGSFFLTEINMMDTHDYGRKINYESAELGLKTNSIPEFIDFKRKLEKQILGNLDNVIQEFCLEFLNK